MFSGRFAAIAAESGPLGRNWHGARFAADVASALATITLVTMSAAAIDLGNLADLGDGQLRVFTDIGEHGVVVCRVAGRLHAVENNCSHRDSPLAQGRLRGFLLTCPEHGAQFDVRDGAAQGPPAVNPVTCFAVIEQNGSAMLQADAG